MRFTIKGPQKELKALDIDLQLNGDKSSSEIRQALSSINQRLRQAEMFDGENYNNNGNVSYIPDDANVKRIDLKHTIDQPDDESYEDRRERIEKEKEKSTEIQVDARGIMKKANREDVFVAYSSSNNIMGIINDYMVVYKSSMYDRSQNDNSARILRNADFILHFKIDEVKANADKSRSRLLNARQTPNIEREKHKSDNKRALKDAYKRFIELINNQSKHVQTRRVKYKDLKIGDIFKEYNSARTTWVVVNMKTSPDDDDEIIFDLKSTIDKYSDKEYERTRSESANDIAYKFDNDITQEVPNIDWKQLLYKRQKFPKALFSKDNLYEIERAWNEMLSYIQHDAGSQKSAQRVQKSKIEEKDYNGYRSSMKYRDKSGYMVDLTKYFDKMLDLIKGTPKIVKDNYAKAFKFIEDTQKEIVVTMKQLAQDEEWDKLKRFIEFMNYYGTKKFNNEVGKVLVDDNYTDENAWNKMSQGKALKLIEQELGYFKSAAQSIKNQN